MNHDEYMKIGHAMMDYNRRFKAFMKNEMNTLGMNFVDGMTVLSLYGAEKATADNLAEEVSCDKSVMTRTLQRLEKDGLVTRQKNPDDGRSWMFCVTAAGAKKAKAAISAIKKWSEKSFENFSEEEIRLLLEMIQKM